MSQSYRSAGVDIDAGNAFVRRIRPAVVRTHRPEIVGGFGSFSGMMSIPGKYKNPVIVAATDGVGTKLALAKTYGRHASIGQDLVAMSVNDVLCSGAEPLAFLDYFATGALEQDVAVTVVEGIARACTLAGCALLGGETAEMPGFYPRGTYDLAGFCMGVAERNELLHPELVKAGDVLLGLRSDGPHSNGYSLIRAILADAPEPSPKVLEEILAPTRIPAQGLLAVRGLVSGISHITGGGLIENVPRMFSPSLAAVIDPSAWERHEAFHWLEQQGQIPEREMLRTFNCGLGFVLAAPPHFAPEIRELLTSHGETVVEIGMVHPADSSVRAQTGKLVLGERV